MELVNSSKPATLSSVRVLKVLALVISCFFIGMAQIESWDLSVWADLNAQSNLIISNIKSAVACPVA